MHQLEKELPNITLIEELGRGNSGIVYRASRGGQSCLVKLPSFPATPKHDQSSPTNLFTRDALALARLPGSGVPRILSINATGNQPYIVMEAVTARSLLQVLREGLDQDQVHTLALQLTQMLHRLHGAGFVRIGLRAHQVLYDSDRERVYLIDHGSLTRVSQSDWHCSREWLRGTNACAQDRHQLAKLLRLCNAQDHPSDQARTFETCCDMLQDPNVDLPTVVTRFEELQSGPRPHSSYPRPSRIDALDLPMHRTSTRDAILQLRAAFRRGEGREGNIVEVVGPAGIGKSHLLASFADEVSAEGAMVLTMRCRDTDWKPFSALRRMFQEHVSSMTELADERREEMFAILKQAAGDMLPWLGMLIPELGPIQEKRRIDSEAGNLQRTFVEGVAEFVVRYLKACPPAVWLVEDVQWLEGSSRDVLARAAARLQGAGLLMAYSRRDDDKSERAVGQLMRMVNPRRIQCLTLGELSESETARIMEAYLGTDTPPGRQLVRQFSELSDGTPVALLDLLQRTLAAGHLTPTWGPWQLDADAARTMRLPEGAQGHAVQRLKELDREARRVLDSFALACGALPFPLLSAALGTSVGQTRAALRRCCDRHILREDAQAGFQFVHNSLQDAVLANLCGERRRLLHHQLAQALEREPDLDLELACELARHHAGAGRLAAPDRVYRTALRAARHAADSYDDPQTLLFLQHAKQAAERACTPLNAEFYRMLAESYWRNGMAADSLRYFERALGERIPAVVRAQILSRAAWVHNYAANGTQAIACLHQAFQAIDRPLPNRGLRSMVQVLSRWSVSWATLPLRPALGQRRSESRELTETLCALYLRAYRIFSEHGHLPEAIYCAIEADRLASALPAGQTSCMTQASVATMLARVGMRDQAAQRLSRVEATAEQLKDPVAATRCAQSRCVIASWLGDVEGARKNAHACAVTRSHFMELGEFSLLCIGMYTQESILGHPRAALQWLERIIERVTLHGHAPPIVAVVQQAVRAVSTTLGNEELPEHLQRQLEALNPPTIAPHGFLHLLSFQSRIQHLTEQGNLGAEFERLVSQYDAAVRDPQRAYPLLAACFVHIIQGRIHGCLRGTLTQRAHHHRALRVLLGRVSRASSSGGGRMARSHVRAAQACSEFMDGRLEQAKARLTEAESLAHNGPCILVLYTAARLRAHIERSQGWSESALEQARFAALLAHRHEHKLRYQWVLEEFGPEADISTPSSTSMGLTKDERSIQRHLNALLHISRTASADLGSEHQAHLILEEIVQSLAAERGLLFLREGTQLVQVTALPTDHSLSGDDRIRWRVEGVYATGQPYRLSADSDPQAEGSGRGRPMLIAPLVLRGEAIGVVCLDRPGDRAPFDAQDQDLLEALANQVPIALELAKTLRERERLEEGLRQAQKMEAIGRLAGGIAHDFNNILATVQLAGGALADVLQDQDQGHDELRDILDVADRGAALTRQLLTFARREVCPPRAVDLNEVIRSLTPMLTRLVGTRLKLRTDLWRELPPVLADTTRLEQVVVNLTTNARDAIHKHGEIVLRTAVSEVDGGETTEHPVDLPQGRYVLLSVADTGAGMSPEVQARIFDPFFTTKPSHKGTGLGLSTVYGIVKQDSGYIQVNSTPGKGTRFDLYWPVHNERSITPPQHTDPPAGERTQAKALPFDSANGDSR